MTYTIVYPSNHPMARLGFTTELESTGISRSFSKLSDGALFLLDGAVHQKMGDCDCAQLVPWDHDGECTIIDDPLCEELMVVREGKK